MAFRRPVKKARSEPEDDGRLVPWQTVEHYAKKLRRFEECTERGRDTVLKEIRRDALTHVVPLVGGSTALLAVLKDQDKFALLTDGDSNLPSSITELARLVYDAKGKLWKDYFAVKSDARRRLRRRDAWFKREAEERDKEWPIYPPDLEGLARLHAHTFAGDRWAKQG